MKFVIVSPRQDSGGPIVLHALCRELAALGHDAQVYHSPRYDYAGHEIRYWLDMPAFLLYDSFCLLLTRLVRIPRILDSPRFSMYAYTPVKGCRRRLWPFVGKDTVVVYPEVVSGNPLHAKKVVRWLMYFHPYGERDDVYHSDDLFFCYEDSYNDPKWNPLCRTLKLAFFNLDLYKQTNFSERTGTCYIIRKGRNRPDLPAHLDGPVIDDLPEWKKAEVLNQCKYCVSYDMFTAYLQIAALCGCIAVAMPEPGKSKQDYGSEFTEKYGVAFGMAEEEIAFAESTRHKVLEKYQRANAENRQKADWFAQTCREYFFKRQ